MIKGKINWCHKLYETREKNETQKVESEKSKNHTTILRSENFPLGIRMKNIFVLNIYFWDILYIFLKKKNH